MPSLSPATLPAGQVNIAYSQVLSMGATGYTSPFPVFSLTGALPLGLSFSGGALSGTPSVGGSFSLTARAVDANGFVAEKAYTLVVIADTTPPVITPVLSGTLGSNNWYIGNVSVSWAVTDPESAVTGTSNCGFSTLSANTPGTTLTCTASSSGGTATRSVMVKIDKSVPTCTVTATPDTLWPPNHKMAAIATSVTPGVAGPSGAGTVALTGVFSSEADSGIVHDDAAGDIAGWSVAGGQLRAERYSTAGRTYTAAFRVTNAAGSSGTCQAAVKVPHSQK